MGNNKKLAVIILAAGESKRLGKTTKQLLKISGETFIRKSVKKALTVSKDVFVILGHKSKACEDEIKDLNIKILFNKNYEKGIGSSISYGVRYAKEFNNILITLCDQPFISTKHLKKLKENIDNENIIASKYEHISDSTVPAIFPKKYFDELMKLNEDKGAKRILKKNHCTNILLSKKQSIDIDTINDIDMYLDL